MYFVKKFNLNIGPVDDGAKILVYTAPLFFRLDEVLLLNQIFLVRVLFHPFHHELKQRLLFTVQVQQGSEGLLGNRQLEQSFVVVGWLLAVEVELKSPVVQNSCLLRPNLLYTRSQSDILLK